MTILAAVDTHRRKREPVSPLYTTTYIDLFLSIPYRVKSPTPTGCGVVKTDAKGRMSANMDQRILKRIDGMCAATHTTRVEMLCVLLRALLAECAPTIKLQKAVTPDVKGAIMRALRRSGSRTVRRLKAATMSKRIRVYEWDTALHELCVNGDVRVTDERTVSGQMRRMVSIAE